MNNHFAYLIEDQSREFFQKVAEERAVSELPRRKPPVALEVVKTAAPIEKQTTFEKIASRLDQDIEMIKMAGTRGEDMGATMRAMNYMGRWEEDSSLSDDEYMDIFEKVAFEALDADLEAIRANMHMFTPPERHGEIDVRLGKIACEFVNDFAEEWGDEFGIDKTAQGWLKALFAGTEGLAAKRIAAGKALSRFGARAASGARGLGRSLAARGTTSGEAIAATRAAGARAAQAIAKPNRLARLREAGVGVARKVRAAPEGVRAWWRERARAGMARQVKAEQAREAAALQAHAKAIAQGNKPAAAREAAKIRAASQAKKVKRKELKRRTGLVEETQTIRGTRMRRGGRSQERAERERGREQARTQAAEAARGGEEAAGQAGRAGRVVEEGDIGLGAAGREGTWQRGRGRMSPERERAERQFDEMFGGAQARQGRGTRNRRGGGPAAAAAEPPRGGRGGGGAAEAAEAQRGGGGGRRRGGGEPRRGRRAGVTRREAEHEARNRGRGRTPRMRERAPGERRPGREDIELGPAGGGQRPSDAVIAQNAAEKGGVWSKAYNQGWGSLTDAEKTRLVMQAGGGLVAAKALDIV